MYSPNPNPDPNPNPQPKPAKTGQKRAERNVAGCAVLAIYSQLRTTFFMEPTTAASSKQAKLGIQKLEKNELSLRSDVTLPFQDRSPVLGTNYLEFEWLVPKTGLRF